MPGYNTTFELTVEDMELIEDALRGSKQSLSSELIDQADDPLRKCTTTQRKSESTQGIDASMKRSNDLLGRLHNQKQFYRPSRGAYVSG